ncbi:ribonuclease Z [Endozoicomonas arenosclerae]|uniref:ribonuclease Z n=1 Tax=Endozoicomonas arenosclerae TaxID=1633495 RepID=UPI00078288B8|nr:ribonuclease Z [Endozoicomonas arenosclerae]
MRFTFLGTSAGSPTVDRNVTAMALALDESRDWYLVDCGEGTQQRLLKSRYTLSGLSAIFITHIHGDHMFGLPGLLTSASMQGRKAPLTICAPEGVESFVRHALKCAAVSNMPYELNFVRSDEPDFHFQDQRFSVSSHALSHRVPSFAYRFQEKPVIQSMDQDKLEALDVPRGPLWGELQNGNSITLPGGRIVNPEDVRLPPLPGRVAIIGGDNDQPDLLIDAMKGVDVLVHEATFTDPVLEKVGPQYMHSTASMVGEAAEKGGVNHIILTHISGRYRKHSSDFASSVEALRSEAQSVFSGQVELAEDFGCWALDRERTLARID